MSKVYCEVDLAVVASPLLVKMSAAALDVGVVLLLEDALDSESAAGDVVYVPSSSDQSRST